MRRYYLSVISGQRRGLVPALLRGLLWMAQIIYATLHWSRQVLYRIGVFRSHKFPCPVVSVGNITAGGTGKTPLVEFLARWFVRRNCRVAILARGRSEEHTSELQSRRDLVCRLLLEKKKQ